MVTTIWMTILGSPCCDLVAVVMRWAVMTIKVALEHRTSYTFDRPVRVFPHVVRLRPAPHSRTAIEAYSLRVEPADHFVNWQQDAVGNFVYRLTFPNPTSQLTITVGLIADLKVINPFDFFIEDWAETWPSAGFTYPEPLAEDLKPYLRPVDEHGAGSGPGELVQAWVSNFAMAPGTRTINFLVELNRRVNSDLGYSLRMEHGVQTPDFTLRTGVGSCRDFAWLLVSILRQMGLAARFVSGYLVQLASDVKALDGPSGPAADFTDLHAWAEVYIPGAGWIGLDPTSGLFAGEGHIPLAATPSPESAAPDHRQHRSLRGGAGVLQHRHPHPRRPSRHAPLHRRGMGDDPGRRARSRHAIDRRRCPIDRRWRAHIRVGGQPGRRRVDHRCRRPAQTRTRLRAGRAAESAVGTAGAGPPRTGPVVSR